MTAKTFVAAFIVMGMGLGSANAARAAEAEKEKETMKLVEVSGLIVPMAPAASYETPLKRPAALPVLYVSLGALQVLDIYSTNSALQVGAREANPAASPFAGSTGAMIGLKTATTASSIFFAERLWKKNKAGAIIMMAAVNGAAAAVSIHNLRNAKMSRAALPAR
jgi:hypothetical protein